MTHAWCFAAGITPEVLIQDPGPPDYGTVAGIQQVILPRKIAAGRVLEHAPAVGDKCLERRIQCRIDPVLNRALYWSVRSLAAVL